MFNVKSNQIICQTQLVFVVISIALVLISNDLFFYTIIWTLSKILQVLELIYNKSSNKISITMSFSILLESIDMFVSAFIVTIIILSMPIRIFLINSFIFLLFIIFFSFLIIKKLSLFICIKRVLIKKRPSLINRVELMFFIEDCIFISGRMLSILKKSMRDTRVEKMRMVENGLIEGEN